MMLTKSSGRYTLELFSLPCAFGATTSNAVGLTPELAQEIRESYAMLFNAWSGVALHVRFGRLFGIRKICWCWACSAYRHRRKCIADCKRSVGAGQRRRRVGQEMAQSEFDPTLVDLTENTAQCDWTADDYPHLWSRITRLEQHLQTSRPWSLWILFRDRRDTVQFWTFL
jgi:hypothetical protein